MTTAIATAPVGGLTTARTHDASLRGPLLEGHVLAIAAIRKRRGLTQAQLSAQCGVHKATIIRLENSTGVGRFKFSTLEAIGRALGVEAHTLLAAEAPAVLVGEDIEDRSVVLGRLPEDDVITILALARALRSTPRALRRILATRPDHLPRTLPMIDSRQRWSRGVVVRWLAGDPDAAGGKRPGRA